MINKLSKFWKLAGSGDPKCKVWLTGIAITCVKKSNFAKKFVMFLDFVSFLMPFMSKIFKLEQVEICKMVSLPFTLCFSK